MLAIRCLKQRLSVVKGNVKLLRVRRTSGVGYPA